MSPSSKLNAWVYIFVPTRMTEYNHQTLSGAAVRATADMWLLNKMESICKQKPLLLLLQQTKTAKLRNFVILYHFKCVTSLKLYTLYGKTVIFLKLYTIYYSIQQYNIYFTDNIQSVCEVCLHIMFPVTLSRGHMGEFTLSSTTQQIKKTPTWAAFHHSLCSPCGGHNPSVHKHDRSLTQTHTHTHTHSVSTLTISRRQRLHARGANVRSRVAAPMIPFSDSCFFSAITLPLSSPPLVECTWRAD